MFLIVKHRRRAQANNQPDKSCSEGTPKVDGGRSGQVAMELSCVIEEIYSNFMLVVVLVHDQRPYRRSKTKKGMD